MNLFFFLSKLFFAKSHNSVEGASQLYIRVCNHHSGLFGLLNNEFTLKQFVITLPPSWNLIDFGLVTYQKWLFPSIFSWVKFMPGVWAHLSHAKNFSCGAYELPCGDPSPHRLYYMWYLAAWASGALYGIFTSKRFPYMVFEHFYLLRQTHERGNSTEVHELDSQDVLDDGRLLCNHEKEQKNRTGFNAIYV